MAWAAFLFSVLLKAKGVFVKGLIVQHVSASPGRYVADAEGCCASAQEY